MIPEVGHELAAHARIREIVEDVRDRVAEIVAPSIPTASFLAALGEELVAALAEPSAVEHPELIDPDAYWDATLKPQSRSVRRSVKKVLDYAEKQVSSQITMAEVELESHIDDRAAGVDGGDASARATVIDDIASHCQVLHHLVAELIGALPSREPADLAREALDEARRRRAIADVEALKPRYLREAGGDETHQRFAEQQWSETFADRVAHRDLMLRGEVPWRHQELAVVGHDRTRDQLEQMLDDVVNRLQQPLLEVGARLVRRYDTVTAPST